MRLARLALFGVLLGGCYTLQPVGPATPVTGTEVALDLNDAGRVALGSAIGPEIGQIQGRLLSKADDEYLLAVNTVRFLRGGEQVWSGERVRVRSSDVSNAYERRFSARRTATFAAVTVGGAVAFFATRSLLVGGSGSPSDKNPPPGTSLTRPPVRVVP